ncbi:hypothetical protein SFA35_08650 [Pseudomonas sp. HR96]|uniref:hypothetical protein n=1 Tax=Pseudomonas sp. HR96 TaxID=1027966 RepID=UPI002A755D5D|nr:hypothetical protein [Pseudomonas sp. HR96]WPP01412.1 hypothetical protein SFA35_08650 [Pseudomonas sp. HR96]
MTPRNLLGISAILVMTALFVHLAWMLYCAYTKLDPVLDRMEEASGKRMTSFYSGPKGRFLLLRDVSVIAVDPRLALKLGLVTEAEVGAIPESFRRLSRINHRINATVFMAMLLVAGLIWTGWFD